MVDKKIIPVEVNQEIPVSIVGIGIKGDAIAKYGSTNEGYTIIIKNPALKVGDKLLVRIVETGYKFSRAIVVSNIE